MRVFGRVLILAGLVSAFAPAPANAAPILLSSGDSGAACEDLFVVANSNCSLFSFDVLAGSSTFNLEFASDTDVALFQLSTAAATTFLAETSSIGLSPMLGLFIDDEIKTIYSYTDEGLQAFGFDRLEGIPLAGDSSYYLAVLLSPNGFSGIPTSLRGGFACDGVDDLGQSLCPGGGGTFSLQLSVTPDGGPQPVPEPGTLALLGTGALAAFVRRRRNSVFKN